MLAAGRRAVLLRSRCSSWFKAKLGGEDKIQQDAAHAHFIQALEEILEALEATSHVKPAQAPATASSSSPAVPNGGPAANGDAASVLGSRFAGLEVEDDESDGGTEAPPLTRGTSAAPSIHAFDVDDGLDDFEEKLFQIYCLFEDPEKIRDFLKQTWKDYVDNKIDIMAASIITNAAIDLAREQCDEFVRRFPDQEGMKGATNIIWMLALMRSGYGMSVESPGDPFHFDIINMAEWCLLPTFQLLDAFKRVLTPVKVPIYNGQYGWCKASAN